MLGIDLQQILLHLFNFSILALLLNILLYQPIVKFIDNRKRIYTEMENKTTSNLAKAEELFNKRSEELKNVRKEADKIKDDIIEESKLQAKMRILEAKKEAERILENSKEKAKREREALIRNTKKDLKEVVVEAASKLAFLNPRDTYDEFIEHIQEDDDE